MSRQDRVSSAIKKEVSLIIHDRLKDPRLGFVTITGVDVSKDLRNAKVFYSVLGNQEDVRKTQEALDSALGLIRSLVAARLDLRFAPEIIFRQDHSSEYSVRIEEVLNEIKERELDEPKKSGRRLKRKK